MTVSVNGISKAFELLEKQFHVSMNVNFTSNYNNDNNICY